MKEHSVARARNYGCAQEQPKVNLWQDAECVFIKAELSCVKSEDLDLVLLEGDQLSIKGKRHRPNVADADWLRKGRSFGDFRMAFELCCGVDGDGVRATMKSKLLHLCLPKAATEKQMKIKIETAV